MQCVHVEADMEGVSLNARMAGGIGPGGGVGGGGGGDYLDPSLLTTVANLGYSSHLP